MANYMINALQSAVWKHSKKRASLVHNDEPLIRMEFRRKMTRARIGKEKLDIFTEGFWCPKILISEDGAVIALQKQLGFWGSHSECIVDDVRYLAKTKQGTRFNITYFRDDIELLTYKLDTIKSKPIITFKVKGEKVSERHLLILMILGFYSIKNVAMEALSGDFTIAAAS